MINPAISYTLDSRPTEGAPCWEPLEQSVLISLAVRPVEGITEKVWDWKPVINPVISYTLDSQPMEGTTYLEHPALGVSLDSRLREGMSHTEILEQSSARRRVDRATRNGCYIRMPSQTDMF